VKDFCNGPTVRLNEESLAAIDVAKGMQHRLEALEAEVERRTTGIAERMVRMSECLVELKTMQLVAFARVERLERYLTTLQETLQAHVIAKREYDPAHEAKLAELREWTDAIHQDLAEMDRQRQPKEPT